MRYSSSLGLKVSAHLIAVILALGAVSARASTGWPAYIEATAGPAPYPVQIEHDTDGSVFLFAQDAMLRKYSTNGILRKTSEIPLNCFTIDNEGNLIVGGFLGRNLEHDGFVAKYNKFGRLLWQTPTAAVFKIAVNASGEIVTGGQKLFDLDVVQKLGPDGDLEWSDGAVDRGATLDLAFDSHGNPLVLSRVIFGRDTPWSTLVKYDTAGNRSWFTTYKGINDQGAYPWKLRVDSQDNALFCGSDRSATTKLFPFVALVNPTGHRTWVSRFTPKGHQSGQAFSLDSEDNAYLATVSELNLSVIKLDSTGAKVWSQTYTPEMGGMNADSTELGVSQSGQIFLAGGHQWNTDGQAMEEVICLRFAADGTPLPTKTFIAPGSTRTQLSNATFDASRSKFFITGPVFEGDSTSSARTYTTCFR